MRNKRMQFGSLRERVFRKVETWKNKQLSAGGKEVLLKAVVQAIPNYTMSCFRIPESICRDIDRACARFWWGDTETKSTMHWRKWEELCKPKERGGLGFRRISSFNRAMLAKQVWRCLTNPNLLVARVLRAKYFQNSELLDAKIGSNASFVWRSICSSRDLIRKGMQWKVGRNSKLKVVDAAFVPTIAAGFPYPKTQLPDSLLMEDLMDEQGEWEARVLVEYFEPAMVEEIKRVKIGNKEGDWRYWKFDDRGNFSVKSGYLADIGYYEPPPFQQGYDSKEWTRLVWKLKVPPKVKIFFWRTVNDIIPTTANLRRHHVPTAGLCDLCRKYWGTTIHCLFFCDKIKKVWRNSKYWRILKKHEFGVMIELSREMRAMTSNEEFGTWVMTMWKAWRYLCLQKHEPNEEHLPVSIELGRESLEEYKKSCEAVKQRLFFGVQVGVKIWKPPIQGVYRIDVDACFDEAAGIYGVGIVIRNNSKELCAAMALPIHNPGNVLEAELNALIYGAGLCLQEQLGPVVMYSDSLNAVRTIAKMRMGEEEIQPGFDDFIELCRESFIIDVCHMYRDANAVAHTLARFGAMNCNVSCWSSNFPIWLRDIVKED